MKRAPGSRRREDRRRNHEGRKRYFSPRWARLRGVILARDRHLCQECMRQGRVTTGNQIDHILPADERPDLFWTMTNLETLCQKCHAVKTRAGK